MAKKKPKSEVSNSLVDAPVLTAQQKEQLAKEKKAQQRAEKKEYYKTIAAEAKAAAMPAKDAKEATTAVLVLIGVVVLICVLLLALQWRNNGYEALEGSTYYLDGSSLPDMDEEGMTGVITEAYYTNNGGMRVFLRLGNGMQYAQHPTKIQLKLLNEKDEVIAHAATDKVHEDFYVVAGGYDSYELFIPEKYVEIKSDPLSTISYELTIESEKREFD